MQLWEVQMKKLVAVQIFMFSILCLISAQSYSRKLSLQSKRMNGADVKELQANLLKLGYSEVGEVDGWFGPNTEKSLKSYQQLHGFEVNGVFDGKIFDCMYNSGATNAQFDSALKTVKAISKNKDKMSKREKDYDHSTEGGYLAAFSDGKKYVFSEAGIYGESGQSHYYLYNTPEGEVFVEESSFYAGHMGVGGVASVEYGVWFIKSNVIYEVKEGKIQQDYTFDYSDLLLDLRRMLR